MLVLIMFLYFMPPVFKKFFFVKKSLKRRLEKIK